MAWLFLFLPILAAPADDLRAAKEAVRDGEYAHAITLLSTYLEANPSDLEAHYWRGIAYRERGKHPTLKNRVRQILQRGAQDFEGVLAQDSAYQDVLFQYALLKKYQGDLRTAISLGEAQLRHRRDMVHVLAGVLDLYWRYLAENAPEKARQWLRTQSGLFTQVFIGRTYERQGLFDLAESYYEEVIAEEEDHAALVRLPVRLALARLDFARRFPEAGTVGVMEAIEDVETATEALVLFQEIRTIASPAEISAFRSIQNPADYRIFFEVFWISRDPMPAAPYNARMAEHYRRLRVAEQDYLFYGFRSWYRSQFTHEAAFFPETYTLSQDYDDRGIIFIRHGEPDDYTVGEANSWLYRDSLLVFHFAPTCMGSVCSVFTHFVPSPEGPTFHPGIVGLDYIDAERRTGAFLMQGLSTDRHTWPAGTRLWEMPYMMASFRGLDGRSLVEVYYRVPLEPDDGRDSTLVEVGFAAHDARWQQVSYVRASRRRAAGAFVERVQVDLAAAPHNLSLYAREADGPHLAAHRFQYTPARFDQLGLKVSDLLLADSINVLPDAQLREDYLVHVNPAATATSAEPVFAYFEVYDLLAAPDGQTRYYLAYTLIPDRGGRSRAIALQTQEQRSESASPIEHVAIDLTDVPKGRYTLEVTITDLERGQEAVTSRSLEIKN
ncbi:MAG: GWxTD domain-containing protein [Bacteroidota bacterium]|nr:GWxTD domain-containing protein [Bacteroidota bacterium]